jgi:hypothetical protein
MPHGVHAAMKRMQPPMLQPPNDCAPRESERDKLRPRHDPVLAPREARQSLVRTTRLHFGTYTVLNCSLDVHGPMVRRGPRRFSRGLCRN